MAVTAQEEPPAGLAGAGEVPCVQAAGVVSGTRGRAGRLKAALGVIEAEDAAALAEAERAARTAAAEAEHGRKLTGRKPKDPVAALARAQADRDAAAARGRSLQYARDRKLEAAARGERVEGPDRAGSSKPRSRSGRQSLRCSQPTRQPKRRPPAGG